MIVNVIGYTDDGVMNNRALIKMPKCVSSFDRIDFVLFPKYNSCKNEISEITYGELYTRILKNVRHSLSMERLYIDIGQMTKTVRAFEMSYIDGTILDLFSLSCRALGRNVEDEMIKVIKKQKISIFYFSNTGKNEDGLFLKKFQFEIFPI